MWPDLELRDGGVYLFYLSRRGAMQALVKTCMVGVLGLTMLVGNAAFGVAAPKVTKTRWDCICTCTARDKNGQFHEGFQTHFQTEDASGCAIGAKFKCTVDTPNGSLEGNYHYCPTQWKGPAPARGPRETMGVPKQGGGTLQR
jgi:hypothetical protein